MCCKLQRLSRRPALIVVLTISLVCLNNFILFKSCCCCCHFDIPALALQIQPSQQFVSLLLQRSQDLMPAASMTDLAMLVWGLGRLGCVAAVTRRKVASSSGSGKVILHHHQHNQQPVEQRSRLLNATTLLASTAGSSHSSSRSSSSSGAHQQQVLTAAAGRAMESTVTISDSWLCDFQYHSLRVLSRGGVRDFVNLLVGLVRMRVKPGELCHGYCCWCLQHHNYNSHALSHLVLQ